jgi:hypothetical protein
MGITDIFTQTCKIVVIDNQSYRRWDMDNWEVFTSDSWERVYYCEELENIYQQHLHKKYLSEIAIDI